MSQITVNNTAHKGYRRAGLSFDTGGNVLAAQELSEKQLAQLHGDPRLVVIQSEAAPGESTDSQGALDEKRLSELVACIEALDKDDSKQWRRDGSPKASAFPNGTTEPERAAAWSAFLERLEAATPEPGKDEIIEEGSSDDEPPKDSADSEADSESADDGANGEQAE